MITILLLSVIHRFGPGDDDDILVGFIPHTLAGHDKLTLLNLTTVGTPTGASIARTESCIGSMPHMAVIAGENDHSPRVSRQFQDCPQHTDTVDRPVVTHLLGTAESVVDGIDNHADNTGLRFENGFAQVFADDASR